MKTKRKKTVERNPKERFDEAEARVALCFKNPTKYGGKRASIRAAKLLWKSMASHQCYWNDRFCIAVACGLPFEQLQEAVWAVLCNGHIDYFEWTTHGGHDMAKVFEYLGIHVEQRDIPLVDKGAYCTLPAYVLRAIALMFELPTTTYGTGAELSPEERALRTRLNKLNEVFNMQ